MLMNLRILGTDFYNEKLEKVKTVPYKNNYGYMFTSGPNTLARYGKENNSQRTTLYSGKLCYF